MVPHTAFFFLSFLSLVGDMQMWACAKGQIDAALTLYHWNGGALGVCNKDGQLPLALARQRGHHNLAAQVEQLEKAHFKTPAPAPAKVSFSQPPYPLGSVLVKTHTRTPTQICFCENPIGAKVFQIKSTLIKVW